MKSVAAITCSLFALLIVAQVAGEMPVMGAREMFLWAGFVSLFAGMASAIRTKKASREALDILRIGLNTAVMGTCVSMLAYRWVMTDGPLMWSVIGGVGMLSMGGLASIDLVRDKFKQRINQKLNQLDDQEGQQ